MKPKSVEQPGPYTRAFAYLLLAGGLLVVAALIMGGFGAARRDEPDMAHVNQIGGTVFCGGPAVMAIIFGLYIRRWGWK